MYSGSTLPRFVWFGYDPLGRCVKRWLGDDQGNAPESEGGYAPGNPNPVTTYLYYDGWNLVQEGTAPDSPTLLYVHGGRVDEVVAQIKPQSNQLRYLQYDARGHCVFQTGTSKQIEEQYEYDAFGLPYFYDGSGTPTTLANGQPGSLWGNRILFTGREYLSDMRIYDFRHRIYHPELGRFLQPDPKHFAAGDYNLYRYCHNDPVNRSDPFGLELNVVQSLTRQTMTVTDTVTGKSFTIPVTSGNNDLGSIPDHNLGPLPLGTYSIYERPEPHKWGNTKAYILDRNDSTSGNDINDDEDTGKGRFAFRYHIANDRLPNRGSEGCNVSDKKSLDKFARAADKTRKGPSRTIESPKKHPGDGLPVDKFKDLPRIGTWKVVK